MISGDALEGMKNGRLLALGQGAGSTGEGAAGVCLPPLRFLLDRSLLGPADKMEVNAPLARRLRYFCKQL